MENMTNFMNLPSETRVIVYRHLAKSAGHMRVREQLLPSDVVRYRSDPDIDWQAVRRNVATETYDIMLDATKLLRSHGRDVDYAGFDMVFTVSSAPILRVSRQIRSEAEWEFLSTAPGHLSVRSRLPLDLKTLPWLRKVNHLSMDYSFLSPNCMPTDRNHNWRQVDQKIAAFIRTVSEVCESLRTFALHILSDRCCDSCGRDFMHDALQTVETAGATAAALANLVPKVRDSMTIVAFGGCNSYHELRNAISPVQPSGFASGRLDEWPGMKLNPEQLAANDLVWRSSTHLGQAAIRAWFFKMPTSNKSDCDLIPAWQFLGRHELYIRDRELNEDDAKWWQESNLEQTLLLRSRGVEPTYEDPSDNTDEEDEQIEGEDMETVQGEHSVEDDPMSQSAIDYMNSFF